ncbi:LAMA1 protein, partial [Crypturellus undulatus]|nr:LAMA1 protein [Crypturellus undulatus]
ECNCHNKAEDCYYDQSIEDQKRSINIHGEYIGGGVCLNCTQHTTGINCEICANGYYGNPLEPGQPCVPCECHGNVNPQEEGHCDSVTGRCLKCAGNTAGDHCERCADGYYGDALVE